MVNCKKCGAPLSLNEAFCPYCGEPNLEAQEHLKKLQELDEQFQNTSREVAAEVKKSKKGYGILVILVMLLLANLRSNNGYLATSVRRIVGINVSFVGACLVTHFI